jgi:DNA-binding response OmpR family regulator
MTHCLSLQFAVVEDKLVVMSKVLVIESDVEFAKAVTDHLLLNGHSVDFACDTDEALDLLRFNLYDVILLNPGVPGTDEGNFCWRYRSSGGSARIFALTSINSGAHRQQLLDSGADDVLSRPFEMGEFAARLRALMRRSLQLHVSGTSLVCGDLVLDLQSRSVNRNGTSVRLLPQEFALLEFLMRNPNRIFSAESLMQRVWRGHSSVNTVRTHIKTLRRKIDTNGASPKIQTIHGVGYGLKTE